MAEALWKQRSLILVGLLFVACAAPVLSVEIPAMVDYVNHLAEMHLLVDAAAGRPNPAYEVDWQLYPNLAMDLIVPMLARFVSVETAARLFLLASQILVVSGAIALETEVRGRHQLSGFAALIALYSQPFLWGMMSFEFGCGVALWAIVFWIRYREGPWLVLIASHAGFVGVLFVAHFFSLGIYGLTIGCYELSRIVGYRQALRIFATMAFPPLVLYLFLVGSGGSIGEPLFAWWFGLKLSWPLLIMNGYNLPLSIAMAVTLAAFLAFLGRNRVLRLTRPAVFILCGFALVYLLLPTRLFGSDFADIRLITAMMLILPAFLTVSWPSRAVQSMAALVAISVIVINAVTVARVWFDYRSDYSEIIDSFRLVRPGSSILVTRSDAAVSRLDAPMYYAPTLAAHYANAFVSSLYSIAGHQPIRKAASKSRFEMEDPHDYLPTPLSKLADASAGRAAPLHVREWRTDYDYVYIVGEQTDSVPDHLISMMRSRRFTLYAIGK
jgi:hypothetical protein